MQLRLEIPDSFWSLFRSVNREVYIDALLCISQEYEYSNYFLTREVCLQVLSDMNARRKIRLEREESESDFDMLETPASRILNWLVRTGWLKRVEDFTSMTTNIVIPDYSAVMIGAFERLTSEDMEETEIYIQNVYATLYSFRNDPRVNLNMLRTALVNTRRLNKALQDMLHNMDKFFERLLDKENYRDLLEEHLDGYVEEVVRKKYHILKTSDNFYIYKNDIGIKIDTLILTNDYFKINVNFKLPEDIELNTQTFRYGFAVYDENGNIYGIQERMLFKDEKFHTGKNYIKN